MNKVQTCCRRFYPAFLPQQCLALSTTSTMPKWAQSFRMDFCGSAEPFQKTVKLDSVGDRNSSSQAVTLQWALPATKDNQKAADLDPVFYSKHTATLSKHSPCCPHSLPGEDKGANTWQMFVSHEMLQQGVQCQVLDRPVQLLLQQPVTGRRVQCSEQDCSWGLLHQGSLWQIEVSGHQMHPGRPMDALPTSLYFRACAERLKWPLQWGYSCLLYSWDIRS